MVIKVQTYGNVSPSFRNLTTEILENVSKNMKDIPPVYHVHICKTFEEYENVKKERNEKLERITGNKIGAEMSSCGAQTFSYFEYPETILVEDEIVPRIKTLEQLEGVLAHEEGHAVDYFTNRKLTFSLINLLLPSITFYVSNEFAAEKNAINPGYYSGVFANNVYTIKNTMKKETIDSNEFLKNLSIMGCYAAFMQSKKPKEGQKQCLERLWEKMLESRKFEISKSLLKSKELKEQPEGFGNESFLEDFVWQKHHGWGFSLI